MSLIPTVTPVCGFETQPLKLEYLSLKAGCKYIWFLGKYVETDIYRSINTDKYRILLSLRGSAFVLWILWSSHAYT